VKGDKACFYINGHQEGGDIAVSYDDLGVFPDQVITDFIKESEASISAPSTENGLYFLILEHGMQIPKTGFILSCQVIPSVVNVGRKTDSEPGRFQYLGTGLEFGLTDRAGRRDNADLVSRLEFWWFYKGWSFDMRQLLIL